MTMIPQHPYAATTTSTSFENFAHLDKKFHKYHAFGQFIAASLADLAEEKATDVMQRITMEIFAAQRDLNWNFIIIEIILFHLLPSSEQSRNSETTNFSLIIIDLAFK